MRPRTRLAFAIPFLATATSAAQTPTRTTAPSPPMPAQQGAASAADTAPSVRWNLITLRSSEQVIAERLAERRRATARGDSTGVRDFLGGPLLLISRVHPLVNAAMYEAAEAARADAQRPSARAAVASASAAVLAQLYPTVASAIPVELERDLDAERRAAVTPQRIEAGVRLGREVAAHVLEWARGDGYDATWSGTVPTGAGMWWSAPGGSPGLVERLLYRPWFLRSKDQFRPKPPPAFGSPEFTAALDEVRRVARERTAEQTRIAQHWGLRPAINEWAEIASKLLIKHRVADPKAAHVLAMLGAVSVDAGIACSDAKYQYWLLRPTQADSAITLADRLTLPNFPAYPSGHACLSGAMAEVVGHFVPDERVEARRLAEEAAMSRLYAGMHYRFDNDTGLELGRQVARYAIAEDSAGRLRMLWNDAGRAHARAETGKRTAALRPRP